MEDELSIVSAPDQLPIVEQSSVVTAEEPLKAIPPKFLPKKIKSKKLQDILKPKTSIKRRYFTSGVKVNRSNVRTFENESSPFEFPKDFEEFAHKVLTKAWRNDVRVKELEKKVFQRTSYNDRQKRDLLNRLYVEEPQLEAGKAALDIDPNYFSVVEGKYCRPIPDRVDIRQYIQTVRESLRTKIVIGFREDDIMLIDETMKLEQRMIDMIRENLQTYINIFEEFLILDHRSAMSILQEAEVSSTLAYDKYNEYNLVVKRHGSLRSSLFNLEMKWKQCKSYHRFLYNVSPMTWRLERLAQKSDRRSIYLMDEGPEDMTGIFGNLRKSIVEKGLSVMDILNEFSDEIESDMTPELYFTHPEQLLDVFRFVEQQNLSSLLHSEELAAPLASIKESMRSAEEKFDREIKQLQEIIDKLELGISWEEQRVKYLEEFAVDLISSELKKILMDEDILNLYVYVEDVYESGVAPNDANHNIWEMMKEIEEKYRSELLSLDKVPSEQVALLEGNYYREQLVVMKLAERAARQFAELEQITTSLMKTYTPVPEKRGKDAKFRSLPTKPPRKPEELERELTGEEKEFLEFFTDYCDSMGDPRDFVRKAEERVSDASEESEHNKLKGKQIDSGIRFKTFTVNVDSSSSSSFDQLIINEEKSEESDKVPLQAARPKVRLKNRRSKKLQKVLEPHQPVVNRYFTAGVKVNAGNARDVEKEPSPFSYPKDMQEFAHKVLNNAWREDARIRELKQKYYNKQSNRGKDVVDLLNRLYVDLPPQPDDASQNVGDIDTNYYEIVQGRPIQEKLDIRQYVETVRDSLRTKVITGYRQDDIILIEETLFLEQKMIDIVKDNLQTYINAFEEFLITDHTSAMELLRESDTASQAVYTKYDEYKAISKRYSSLTTSLFTLEEKWRTLKMYQRFLHSVSPMQWKMAQEQGHMRRASIYVSQYADQDIFTTYRSSILKEGVTLEDIVSEFQDETSLDTPPALYFTEPEQLMEVFRFIEMQNLNALLHSEELSLPLEEVKAATKDAVTAFNLEIKNLQEIIDNLEGGIRWEEAQAVYLERLTENLLATEFKNLIHNDEFLSLFIIVEDIYESKIGPNDTSMGMVYMMKAIEEDYRKELLLMDKVPSKEVVVLERAYYAEESLTMKLAEKAAKDFAYMETVISNMKKAFEPPKRTRNVKEMKRRTTPKNPPKKIQPPPRSLTEAEEDYLEFFTEFCKYTDDPKEFGVDINLETSDQVEVIEEAVTELQMLPSMLEQIRALQKCKSKQLGQ
ncbi:hypothetical protein NQ315_001068 [Exocentrus adspersus]|uniref:Uncharacterized protein n=1 Tax=Exocentrus adspersus TaxID=1586481 RepID=A0AAV8WGP1_9CUCU|nr:hypothetical protein NQ315_001068 [Exocentrus adspersus]